MASLWRVHDARASAARDRAAGRRHGSSASIIARETAARASCASGPSSPTRARCARSADRASFSASASPFGVTYSNRWRRSCAPSFCTHVAFVDQLLEHAAERLLGDAQDIEQLRDLHARIAVDEMQHPVMRAAETELAAAPRPDRRRSRDRRRTAARSCPRSARGAAGGRRSSPGEPVARSQGCGIYVSHVDIFWFDCYKEAVLGERIVPSGR